jgi:hypothetical protein
VPPLRALTLTAALLLASATHSQKPQAPPPQPPAPQLSPKAAYDDAMHPLEATRRSITNWSDVETDALKVTIQHATVECRARDPKTFTGDALVDLARLCALGQEWKTVVQATALYIAADTPSKPLLNQAYAAQINAQLHLKDEPAALTGAEAMLHLVPYDTLAAEAIDEAIDYMQFAYTADALTLDATREPLLLTQIRTKSAPADPSDPTAPTAPTKPDPAPNPTYPPQSIHDLYATGLTFAALQQLAGQPETARTTVAQLDAALPATLTPDDTLPIAAARKRYAFLGQPLPAIAMLASLVMPNKLPDLPAPNAITSLLLFPDWCAQCVRMGKQFPQSVFLIEGHEAYFYALFAETMPLAQRAPTRDGTPPKPTPRELLAETPTLVVAPSVLDQFAATDFPFLLIADSHGIIRVLQPVDETALQSGSTLDTAIARVAAQFPTTDPKPEPKPPTPPQP